MNNQLILFFIGITLQATLVYGLKKINVFQKIYALSPENHKKKSKTPSFGGVAILFTIIIGIFLYGELTIKIQWVIYTMMAFAMLGLFDDLLSFLNKKNKGFSAKSKFIFQIIIAIVSLSAYSYFISSLSLLLFVFYIFIMVGTSNATNLTDGLDGLLAGLSIISLIGFILYFYSIGNGLFAELSIFILTAMFSFLAFNFYPAKIFMGDTGSLSIGASFASLALIADNPWILLPLGAVYIIETLSVIVQVVYFKRTKQRIFLMSPLHHHFELMGFSEKKVCFMFWAIGVLFLALFLFTKVYA